MTSSQTSTYCSCDGGFGVNLSTKTNAAKTTFLVCDVDPALTVSTITPTATSTSTMSTTKITTSESATATGFYIWKMQCDELICPQLSCSLNPADYMALRAVGNHGCSDSDLIQLKGTYDKDGMVEGATATFCGQTSTFSMPENGVVSVTSDSGVSYECVDWNNGNQDRRCDYDKTQRTCMLTPYFACITNICT